MVRVAIIGSAARKGTHQKVTPQLYQDLLRRTLVILKPLGKVDLISGGAAFCDHLAVELYLDGYGESLHLYLPAPWNGTEYAPDQTSGQTSNRYHRLVSERLGRDTLAEIQEAFTAGATASVYGSFAARNRQVAQAEVIIAFGWDSQPSGGTLNTLNQTSQRRIIYQQI